MKREMMNLFVIIDDSKDTYIEEDEFKQIVDCLDPDREIILEGKYNPKDSTKKIIEDRSKTVTVKVKEQILKDFIGIDKDAIDF